MTSPSYQWITTPYRTCDVCAQPIVQGHLELDEEMSTRHGRCDQMFFFAYERGLIDGRDPTTPIPRRPMPPPDDVIHLWSDYRGR